MTQYRVPANSEAENEEFILWNTQNIKIIHHAAKKRKHRFIFNPDHRTFSSQNDNEDHKHHYQNGLNVIEEKTFVDVCDREILPLKRQKKQNKKRDEDVLDVAQSQSKMSWSLVILIVLFIGVILYLKYNEEQYDPDWNTFVNYYKILGVDSTVSEENLKRAYHRLSLKWHPDKNPGCSECAEKYLQIQEAYRNIQKYGDYYKTKRAIKFQHVPMRKTAPNRNDDE
jgi:hypothetical protein